MSSVADTMHGLSRSDPGLSPVSKTIPDANLRNQHRLDFLFRLATRLFAFLVLLLLAGIIVSLVAGSPSPPRSFRPRVLTSTHGEPVHAPVGRRLPVVGAF